MESIYVPIEHASVLTSIECSRVRSTKGNIKSIWLTGVSGGGFFSISWISRPPTHLDRITPSPVTVKQSAKEIVFFSPFRGDNNLICISSSSLNKDPRYDKLPGDKHKAQHQRENKKR
jgi:hypothetical protein